MTKTVRGSENGSDINEFFKNACYDIGDSLYRSFLRLGTGTPCEQQLKD